MGSVRIIKPQDRLKRRRQYGAVFGPANIIILPVIQIERRNIDPLPKTNKTRKSRSSTPSTRRSKKRK